MKSTEIQKMFGKIAGRYDLTNSVLSFQTHKIWNQKLVARFSNAATLLDLCSGTGEIAYRWLNQQNSPKKVIQLDFCQEMLDIAKMKSAPYIAKGHSLQFMQADAAAIPLPNAICDAVSVAYGIRNVQNLEKCFAEVLRVLQPNGSFYILELTEPNSPLLGKLHKLYLQKILPCLGGWITKEKEAYSYLSQSIQAFTKPHEIQKQLIKSGFKQVSITPLMGGIATIIEARK